MSRDIFREVASAITRMRGKPMDSDRLDEWAARLEAHLVELEFLAAQAVSDAVEPAFEATPLGGLPTGAKQPTDLAAQVRTAPAAGPQAAGSAATPPAALKRAHPMTLTAVISQLRARQLSALELVEEHLERIRQSSGLNAFIAVFEEQARHEAMAADKALASGSAGPLAGIPIAIKDLMAIRGYAMTGGSRALDGVLSSNDADVVARLRAAGAVIVGAANLHELAYGVTSENPHFGAVKNPRRPEHMAGGSSGGSAAAVAAHLALGAVGTDTGGSIRIPAAACGVVGLKPTFGRVTRRGVLPLAWSLDHVGPLAGNCADAAVLWAVMADDPLQEERAFAQGGASMGRIRETLSGLRVGRPSDEWLDPLQDDVASAWQISLERLRDAGALVSVVEPPPMSFIRAAQFVVLHVEASAFHRERLRQRASDLGPDVRVRLQLGEFLMAVDYVQGQRLRRQVANGFLHLFDRVDVLVLPALPVAAPALGTRLITMGDCVEPVHRALTRYTAPFNLSGVPALVVPVGTDARGLPLGIQIAGRPFGELDILRVGIAIEALGRLA